MWIALVVFAGALLLWAVVTYNGLVRLRAKMRDAWAGVGRATDQTR